MRLKRLARGIEPDWRRGRVPASLRPGPEMADWLFDLDSLTKRLKRAGSFRVVVLRQRLERPLFCERRALGLPDRGLALVRQVHLLCDDKVKVYARSVLPFALLTGGGRGLAKLGGRPLGERLFRDKSMRRSPAEISPVQPGDLFYQWGVTAQVKHEGQVWGRRSVFKLADQPLLVNEVFLPPLPNSIGFRIKHKV